MTTSTLDHPTTRPPDVPPASSRRARVWHSPEGDPPWARPALLGLLALTALLYLWHLGSSEGNSYYSAAVQAGTKSWKAMLFGSLDSSNAITVDKPAAFLWPMEISGRIFGFGQWSMLVPQALEGVAAVGLLAAAVRRVSGPVAGLLAGAVLALTPVAVLMFRFNNPDAMLALLLTGAAYALVRALQTASTRWLALTGLLVGFGFITKMGQALLVVPALGLAYLIAAPTGFLRRCRQLLLSVAALVAGAGWWVAIVSLWPADSKPYVGGSTNNSILELAFGYNGLGRLFGGSGNGGGGGGGGQSTQFGGATGLTRMFSGDFATEASWLLPTALLCLPVALWLTRRAARTDLVRAAVVLFGGALVATAYTFSEMQGTIHPYYVVALAPWIAGLLLVTARALYDQRATWTARISAAVLVEVTAVWDSHLLGLTPTFVPWLRGALVLGASVGALALLAGAWMRRGLAVALVASTLVVGAGSGAYAVSTANHTHSGSIPSSGPVSSGTGAGMGASTTSTALTALLAKSTTKWAAATVGAQSAAPLQIASGKAVMAIGGFTGSDPAPTLAQFEAEVAEGQIHYFVSGGGMGRGGGMGGSSAIATWVAAHYTATTVGGYTVYDLTAAATS